MRLLVAAGMPQALKYVSFTVQMLGKSFKMIPAAQLEDEGPKGAHEHKDPTKKGFLESPRLGPENQKVGSLCLMSFC